MLNINKFLTFEIPFFKNLFYPLNIDQNKIDQIGIEKVQALI